MFFKEKTCVFVPLLLLDDLDRRAVFFRKEGLCLFIIAGLNVVYYFPPLDKFGTTCCLLWEQKLASN